MRKNRGIIDVVPIYSPRTSYKKIKATDEKMISDMTLNFDKLTINLLKEEFLKRNNSLGLQQFIFIAMKHLKFWQTDIPNRQIALMRYLSFLFNEIDINGNRDMQWEEFTNFIIEKATVLKNLKSKTDEVKQYMKSDMKPKIKIDGFIHKIEYISDMDRLAFCEEGSNKIYFMNLDNGEINSKYLTINPKKLVVNISSVKKEKNGKVAIRKKDFEKETRVRVLDMLYIPEKKYKILLVSTSDGFVRGWEYGQNGFIVANQPDNREQLFEHYFSQEIYSLAWDHINEVLYCGQKSGSIYMWNLKTDLQKVLTESKAVVNGNQNSETNVNMMITSMITMPKLQFMASGRMDGKLILWDTINNKKKWTYKQHSRGILTLAFNQSMILLFSGGFDHKICIWNPYISTLIHKIEGHLSPILSLKVIEDNYQLISMDSQGIVKITDIRRFNFIYSFSVEALQDCNNNNNNKSVVSSLIIINKPLKLLIGGKSITMYEYDKNYNPYTADEHTAICCKYAKDKLSFFTPMSNKIKVWSALNGDIERIYMEVTPNQISTFQFDYLKKRMVVGDSKGNITLHNTANGAKMKTLTKHSGEITNLIAIQNEEQNGKKVDIFISSALDNEIRICKQTEESFEIIRTIKYIKDTIITSLVYSEISKLVIVGSNVGNLSFYEIQTGKQAGISYFNSHQQLTSISKTNQPIIIVTTSGGKITLIGVPPFPNRFEKLITFYHKDNQKVSMNLGIRFSHYSNSLNYLYVIDDKMYLTCYNLNDINNKLKSIEVKKQKIQSERRNTLLKLFQNTTIKSEWQIKCHIQVIKSLEYIQQQQLLITTSYDKKIKIWSALNGELRDSLQQNYHKSDPTPLAYFDYKSKTLFSEDRKKIIHGIKINPVKLQFDPFVLDQIIKEYPEFNKNKISNKQWNINVDFQYVVKQQMKKFEELAQNISLHQNQQFNHTSHQINLIQIKNKLYNQRKVLKSMNYDNNFTQQLHVLNHLPSIQQVLQRKNLQFNKKCQNLKAKRQSQQLKQNSKFCQTNDQGFDVKEENDTNRRLTSYYFKRSIMSSLKKYQNSPLQNHEQNKSKNKVLPKNVDYIPIVQILKKGQRNSQDSKEHKLYIENLYRKQTQSIINGQNNSKIYLSREEAQAAQKLCNLLMKTDIQDKRPKILYQSIQVLDNKKSLPIIL